MLAMMIGHGESIGDGQGCSIPLSLPSGYVKIAVENGPLIVDLPSYKMGISHSYVSLPEGICK